MSAELEQALGVQPGALAFLDQFTEEERSRLLALFEQARELQCREVDQAIEAGLKIVPGFLRKALRRILGDH